jgi:DUF917 family protein
MTSTMKRGLGGSVELIGELVVDAQGRGRSMPHAAIGIPFAVENVSKRAMHQLPLREGRSLVDRGANKRMAEADLPVGDAQNPCP